MIVVFDVGNTRVNMGLFSERAYSMIESFSFETNFDLPSEFYVGLFQKIVLDKDIKNVSMVIVSSVVEQFDVLLRKAVECVFCQRVIFVDYRLNIGINIETTNKSQVGADRIVNVFGAKQIFPNKFCIVVDFGTATTFDIVDKENNFIGGVIAPGVNLGLIALSEKTSKLPKISLDRPKRIIGKNTKDAMLSGVVLGHMEMVKGLIQRCYVELKNEYKVEQKDIKVIATGGFCSFFDGVYCDFKFDVVDKNLTLNALGLIGFKLKENQLEKIKVV